MAPPFGPLTYLYVGTDAYARDLAYHRDVLGAVLVWEFHEFGAHVAALRHADAAPTFLLADHRPAGTVIFIHAVKDLDATTRELTRRGWKGGSERFEVPDGPCVTFKDPAGHEFGLLQLDRPDVLSKKYRPGKARPR
jgi:predicted enzyme related to lactoylglutathione lyase